MSFFVSLLRTHWTYILILLVSLGGLGLLDRRYHLVLFDSDTFPTKSTPRLLALVSTLVVMVGLFLVWDICGIVLGIFHTNTAYTLGLNLITPNLPIEEVLFLALLTYVSLVVYRFAHRIPDQLGTK